MIARHPHLLAIVDLGTAQLLSFNFVSGQLETLKEPKKETLIMQSRCQVSDSPCVFNSTFDAMSLLFQNAISTLIQLNAFVGISGELAIQRDRVRESLTPFFGQGG